MAKLIDRFQTQDGSWDVDVTKPYGISLAALHKYGNEDIPGKGGANHIFVKAKPGSWVMFLTNDGKNKEVKDVDASGWVNFPMFHSSAYVPARGEQGPWNVYVNNLQVATGIGLPDGLHVSTFLVTDDSEPIPAPPPTPAESPLREAIRMARHWIDEAERRLGAGL